MVGPCICHTFCRVLFLCLVFAHLPRPSTTPCTRKSHHSQLYLFVACVWRIQQPKEEKKRFSLFSATQKYSHRCFVLGAIVAKFTFFFIDNKLTHSHSCTRKEQHEMWLGIDQQAARAFTQRYDRDDVNDYCQRAEYYILTWLAMSRLL